MFTFLSRLILALALLVTATACDKDEDPEHCTEQLDRAEVCENDDLYNMVDGWCDDLRECIEDCDVAQSCDDFSGCVFDCYTFG